MELRQHGVAVLVDDLSLGFLGDAQLDYVEELVGSYFKVEKSECHRLLRVWHLLFHLSELI